MNSSESPFGRPSPRRELQGPRPTPLKVNKDSYKIKKPPPGPPPYQADTMAVPPPQPRPPVIIYTVSPKIIHTNPNDFMSLVQSLTGLTSTNTTTTMSSTATTSAALPSPTVLSPAARLALEQPPVNSSDLRKTEFTIMEGMEMIIEENQMMNNRASVGTFPGILSPMPSSLPPISPGFFSPSVDPNSLSFLHELSPAFHGNRSYVENTFLASPNNFLTTPTIPSPGAYWDLFNQLQDP
ncbi:VQ domain-containing protein [Dioscorea alata]|uniref:VQ domain-containing protein n=4 Tax=Dioscorea alata TaxID=55571 RepID=A0ACB7VZP9_DIOAL|nr:VQ domain-containing protein [Dioscorea alata]KAH7680706.1 VQ domain-containing protein [Dioscorea alata]KAH7680707.1 VQ domain-containing protein [Dioscorea alata]KAH7680708.1 VQ domain-containing protein [Dioscorea alata]